MAETSSRSRAVAVAVENVNLSFGANHVLKDVSLEIRPGEMFAFLGPSGCGKTTLLRLIAGFNHADSGRVLIDGVDVTGLAPWKRDVGMVFQSYALWPHMTVAANVAFGLEERGVAKAEVTRRVAGALEMVGMEGLAQRRPSQLSGGQQQRVALARTIVVEPKVLLLDEPLSNLDAQLRVEVRREIRQLQQRLGITTIFVTHDQEEANSIADRMAVMSQGVVAQVGTPIEVYQQPANLFVAGFLGTANILAGRPTGEGANSTFVLNDGAFLSTPFLSFPSQSSRMMFRPQSVSLFESGTSLPQSTLGMSGRIAHREFLGSIVRYAISVGQTEILVDVPFSVGQSLHEIDAEVMLGVPAGAIAWLEA